jgi:hypothetical protein
MEPSNLRFGGGAADSVLSPFFALAALVAIILVLCLRRKYAIMPLVVGIIAIPMGQVVVLAGVHFTVMRILIVAGLGRWAISGRGRSRGVFAGGFNLMDRVFVLFAFLSLLTFSLEWMTMPALIKGCGTFLDTLGGYILLRSLIRDKEDIRRTIQVFAVVAIVIGAAMVYEQIYLRNIFGLLAEGPSVPAVRDGKVRASGPFGVYVTAGAFGATLLPLLVWLWSDAKSRLISYLGFVGATVMTVTTNSSTPDLAFLGGIMALCFWRFRSRMRLFRFGLAFTLIGLQLVMKAPVWALIARVDLTGSSSTNHRYMLVDNFIRHFSEWWLLGFKDYNNWGWDMWDLSNQFVAYGVNGGLVTFALFVALLCLAFAGVGRARKLVVYNRGEGWFFWCIGAALFAHLVAFFGVSYFDQMQFVLYSLLAIISVAVSRTERQAVRKSAGVQGLWASEPEASRIPEPPAA